MYAVANTIRYGLRSLLKRPGATLLAVLSLGVGIGVTTTTFSLLNAMVFRAFPGVEAQERLVTLALSVESDEGRQSPSILFSWPDVEVLQAREALFEGVAAAGRAEAALWTGGEPVTESVEVVSGTYFRLLGSRPFRGRLLDANDVASGAATVVLAHRVAERMGSPDDILGRRVEVNGVPFTVVGVAPPDYTGMLPGDAVDRGGSGPGLWVSLAHASLVRPQWLGADPMGTASRWLRVVARLAEGVGPDRLEAGLPLAARALETELEGRRPGAELVAGDLRFGPGAGPWRLFLTVVAFMAVPVLVLLIACANAANLLLARTTERRRELAVRSALGAGRGALMRQVLAEGALLAAAAGALGLLVAVWSRSIARLFAVNLSMDAPVDLRVFLFAFGTAVVAGILLALLPALGASRTNPARALAGSSRTSDSRGAARLRRGLVVAQVALSLVLLVAAGLFVRSARHGMAIGTGLEEDGLVLVTVDLGVLDYSQSEGRTFFDQLVGRTRSLSGVDAVGLADLPPLDGLPSGRVAAVTDDADYGTLAGFAYVGEGYFAASGVRLLSGRTPWAGRTTSEVVVNRALAEELWPGGDALGEPLRVGTGEGDQVLTVVGVAGDARARLHQAPMPTVYRPREASWVSRATLYVRGTRPAATVRGIRGIVRELDPRLPLYSVETAREVRERELLPWRLLAGGLGTLGGIGLLLAIAGLYGVISFSVARRTREIGVRMALGADRRGVLRLVLGEALGLVAVGLVVGGVVAAAAATLLQSMLFGISPLDPWTYGTLTAALLIVGLLAAVVPGRRAASVQPIRALTE